MAKKIPQIVREKAKELLNLLKGFDYPHAGELCYLGERDGTKYYMPYYCGYIQLGYPEVYALGKDGRCQEYNGDEALNIAISLSQE